MKGEDGFTLVEMLIALLLLAMVLVMAIPAFELTRRTTSVGPQLERAASIATARETLVGLVSAALAANSVDDDGRPLAPLVGRSDKLAFVAPPRLSAPLAGLRRYEIGLAPGGAGQTNLVLVSAPFSPPNARRFQPAPIETTVLVERAGDLAIGYFGPPLAPNTGAARWQSDWDRPTLPTLVEIVFSTVSPSGQRERQVVLVDIAVARTR